MTEQTTIDDVTEGDEIEFEYTTKVMGNRVSKSGEVVQAGGDVVRVEVDSDDPIEGEADVFILQGATGRLKNVYYEQPGQRDTFCGDRARIC
jgi:hypothetical protein